MTVLEVRGKVAKEQVYVIGDLKRPLLRRKPAELLKLISRFDILGGDEYESKVADKYPKLFERLDVMEDRYCITLKKDAKPLQVSVLRKVPFHLYQKIKEELDRTLETRVILVHSYGGGPKKQWQGQGLRRPKQAE